MSVHPMLQIRAQGSKLTRLDILRTNITTKYLLIVVSGRWKLRDLPSNFALMRLLGYTENIYIL